MTAWLHAISATSTISEGNATECLGAQLTTKLANAESVTFLPRPNSGLKTETKPSTPPRESRASRTVQDTLPTSIPDVLMSKLIGSIDSAGIATAATPITTPRISPVKMNTAISRKTSPSTDSSKQSAIEHIHEKWQVESNGASMARSETQHGSQWEGEQSKTDDSEISTKRERPEELAVTVATSSTAVKRDITTESMMMETKGDKKVRWAARPARVILGRNAMDSAIASAATPPISVAQCPSRIVTYHSTGVQTLPVPDATVFEKCYGRKPKKGEAGLASQGRYTKNSQDVYELSYGEPFELLESVSSGANTDEAMFQTMDYKDREMPLKAAKAKAAIGARKYQAAANASGYTIWAETHDEMIVHSEQFPFKLGLEGNSSVEHCSFNAPILPNIVGVKSEQGNQYAAREAPSFSRPITPEYTTPGQMRDGSLQYVLERYRAKYDELVKQIPSLGPSSPPSEKNPREFLEYPDAGSDTDVCVMRPTFNESFAPWSHPESPVREQQPLLDTEAENIVCEKTSGARSVSRKRKVGDDMKDGTYLMPNKGSKNSKDQKVVQHRMTRERKINASEMEDVDSSKDEGKLSTEKVTLHKLKRPAGVAPSSFHLDLMKEQVLDAHSEPSSHGLVISAPVTTTTGSTSASQPPATTQQLSLNVSLPLGGLRYTADKPRFASSKKVLSTGSKVQVQGTEKRVGKSALSEGNPRSEPQVLVSSLNRTMTLQRAEITTPARPSIEGRSRKRNRDEPEFENSTVDERDHKRSREENPRRIKTQSHMVGAESREERKKDPSQDRSSLANSTSGFQSPVLGHGDNNTLKNQNRYNQYRRLEKGQQGNRNRRCRT